MLSKLLQQAAGNAGEAIYVEDVFSTYLYTGNGSTQTIPNGIALGDKFVGTSTYFNGSAYLSRSSDLSGNSDGKTFTFSAWVYATKLTGGFYVYRSGTGSQFYITVADDGRVTIRGFDNIDNSSRLNVDLPVNTVVANQWTNILISFDLSDTASRYVYVNDVAVTPTYFTYQNYNLDFTNSSHFIAAGSASSGKLTGYVTNIFLDYTYRDLSVTANRRYFIDANQCSTPSSTLSALNPILYLPLTSSTTLNAGTGGNFTANSSPVIADIGTDFSAGYGEGGMVWLKGRSGATDHALYDTARGTTKDLVSNDGAAETTQSTGLTAFNTTGFSIGALAKLNTNAATYASWTFRKAPKFFDVVTWTGDGVNGRQIAHNLGSAPGCVIIKCTNDATRWSTWHRSLTAGHMLTLELTNAEFLISGSAGGGVSGADASTFTVSTGSSLNWVNGSGKTYVAYLFAHDAGGFGDDGTENVISCGSFTSDGSGSTQINLGWEPQWIIFKKTTAASQWYMFDTMRGLTVYDQGNDQYLWANDSIAEGAANCGGPNSTGFEAKEAYFDSGTWVYIAIRRGPMKTPESGTEVFSPIAYSGANGAAQNINAGFPVDVDIIKIRNDGTRDPLNHARLMGGVFLKTDATSAEASFSDNIVSFSAGQNVIGLPVTGGGTNEINGASTSNYVAWAFRRAPGFFDAVCYTGTGTALKAYSHNLSSTPELIILKSRSSGTSLQSYWQVAANIGITSYSYLTLQTTNAASSLSYSGSNIFSAAPTSTTFTVGGTGTATYTNGSGVTYVAYLFATCPGVSKVGSYTGTGTTLQINCGFTGGARFVMIKRTDSTGDWYVWDSARGIVAGNDPYLLINSTAAEVTSTDYIDPYSAGFEISSTAPAAINANGGSFIYLAIA